MTLPRREFLHLAAGAAALPAASRASRGRNAYPARLHSRDLHHLAIGDHVGCADASPALTRSTKETIDRGFWIAALAASAPGVPIGYPILDELGFSGSRRS